MFANIYKGRKVLITGHAGFKGSWLSLWLTKLGAEVTGYSLSAPTNPNHFDLLNLEMNSIIGDIRDRDKLNKVFKEFKPEVVFHLAAQPLVRKSYLNPIETYETNVIGTLNVFEACRFCSSVKAIVNITSDKCYENKEWVWGYRENDPMGGYDIYSSSKGCAEILTSSYRNSFFNKQDFDKKHQTLLACCRAGNVIGGGDWAEDRLIPDIMRATSKGEKVILRNPNATRPWQHVLEPLGAYLLLGQKLLQKEVEFADAWNFGPNGDEGNLSVLNVVKNMKEFWTKINYEVEENANSVHEAYLLKLDCSKANSYLKWKSIWNSKTTFEKTANWYKSYYEKNECLSEFDLENYLEDAKTKI